jgi:hypothetical protein
LAADGSQGGVWHVRLGTQLLWDPEHAPEETMDDTEIYGARPTARSAWPAWLLLLTCLGGVASAASPAAATRPAAAQVLYAATSGAGVGVYVAAEYFRNEAVLQVHPRICLSTDTPAAAEAANMVANTAATAAISVAFFAAAGLVSTRGERRLWKAVGCGYWGDL